MGIPAWVRNKVTGRQWYHQRFDGSPMYLYAVGEAEIRRERRKPAGTEADVRACFFADGKADWYLDMVDIRRGAAAIIRRARRNSRLSRELLAAWRRDEQAFQKFFDTFEPHKLRGFSDAGLLEMYRRYYELFIRRFTSSSIIDHFALGTDVLIANRLRREVGELALGSAFAEIFSIATAPVNQSFINAAEMELLRLAAQPRVTESALRKHQRRYFWVKNNYFSAHVLDTDHFAREIKIWRRSGADLRAKQQQLRVAPQRNARAKAALLRRYHLSRLLRTLLKVSEDFTWWQDERKKATYLNIHLGTQILGEMARRRRAPSALTKFLVPPEVPGWFSHGVPTVADLRQRERGCAVVVRRVGYAILVGRDILRLRSLMLPPRKHDLVSDLRGLSASVGRAVGTVRVVGSVNEIAKVNAGDILVAVMTRPDYIAGIKKAAAIVTNEGGITCHAAIVSRELGVPCVIGTKIATQVLKDGDTVEVDAIKGVVKVLKRA